MHSSYSHQSATEFDELHHDPTDVDTAEILALVPHSDIDLLAKPGLVVRVFDIVASVLLLLLTMPLLVGIAIAIKISGPGPIFFRQARSGLDGVPFQIVKFRTMIPDATERLGDLLNDDIDLREDFKASAKLRYDPRVSAVGNILRPSGLDELPQLWNVFLGDMSIVGPRPLSLGEERRYGVYAPLIWTVKPGMTGAWQIGGRNDITYAERVAIDVKYARECSLRGDLEITARTAKQFLTGRLRGGY